MTLADLIYEASKTLPHTQAEEVLDFIGYLKHKSAGRAETSAPCSPAEQADADWAEFEKLAGAWSGKFHRDECYDRPMLR